MRFVYYLMKLPKNQLDEISNALLELKNSIKLCPLCFNPFEISRGPTPTQFELCPICRDAKRDKSLLCIVEKEADLLSLEGTKKFNGLYFILGGTIGMMRKEDVSKLRIEQLKNRIKNIKFSEIIVALNPTTEGRATSALVESVIKEAIPSPTFKITHLARGIPVGGEMEYADEETLESALLGRK